MGNDFLPHLPSLEIRQGAIDTLADLYKTCFKELGGYICDGGEVSSSLAQPYPLPLLLTPTPDPNPDPNPSPSPNPNPDPTPNPNPSPSPNPNPGPNPNPNPNEVNIARAKRFCTDLGNLEDQLLARRKVQGQA